MKQLAILVLLIGILTACGSSETTNNDQQEKKAEVNPQNESSDLRISAVEVNNILTLSQAQVYVLVDSLLKVDVDSMAALLNEVQIELLAIEQVVHGVSIELDGAEYFKAAVLEQLEFVNENLKVKIPEMIQIAQGGDKETANKIYFEFIETFGKKSEKVLKSQEYFVKTHKIKFE